jgi:protein-S-isoprenylcysteine O-methyltransferase Ste14
MIHGAGRNLIVSALLVIVPLAGASQRLVHPAPWLAFLATWLTFATQPQLGPQRMVGDSRDRMSALGILAALLVGLVVGVLDFGYRQRAPATPFTAFVAGALSSAGGLTLRIWSIRTLGRFFTATVAVVPGQTVIEHGPYAVLRHPSYTGAALTALGISGMLGSMPGALVTLLLCIPAYAHRIAVEERALVAELGPAYREYRTRTWALVPFVY